jgi:hypothetical protein
MWCLRFEDGENKTESEGTRTEVFMKRRGVQYREAIARLGHGNLPVVKQERHGAIVRSSSFYPQRQLQVLLAIEQLDRDSMSECHKQPRRCSGRLTSGSCRVSMGIALETWAILNGSPFRDTISTL